MPVPSLAQPTQGVLLIADITGYTVFLKESELAHAHGVLSDLLSVLVDGTRPPLTISRLEGDAVFSYGIDIGAVSGQTFVEMVEGVYVAFRRAIEQIVLNSSCSCNACANIGGLDLKFIIHYGEFLIQSIGTYQELLGTDVNMAHRLTKNTVTASTGVKAYALYSQAAVEGLGLGNLVGEWIRRREEYDAGEVEVWIEDMGPVWEAARQRSVIDIPDSDIADQASIEIPLPIEVVWDRVANADYRRMLVGSDRQVLTGDEGGRLGIGDVFQCYHGDAIVPSVILEWFPFTRLVTNDLIHVPGHTIYLTVDYRLESIEGGTRLTMVAARPTGTPEALASFAAVAPHIMEAVGAALVAFKDRIEAELPVLIAGG